jgi:hypothetical protein
LAILIPQNEQVEINLMAFKSSDKRAANVYGKYSQHPELQSVTLFSEVSDTGAM